jgi:nucleotide-binding universal stress UspA family protein
MADEVILCADGSELSTQALTAGLALIGDAAPIVVTVVQRPDPMLVTGTGMAGGTMTGDQFVELERTLHAEGEAVVRDTAAALGIPDAETRVLEGEPGPTICAFADELDARAIVIGTRGRGGFKRALLGSVSDHVVRNAPCPVIVVNSEGAD